MKNFTLIISVLTSSLWGINQEMSTLPWIDGCDEEAIFYAAPFLPENPVIVEAGTAGGADTKMFKELWPNSVIYGFEAHPDSYEGTINNLAEFSNVYIYPLALSDTNGTTTFYLSQENGGASSLLKDNFSNITYPDYFDIEEPPEEGHYQDLPITVQTVTLDSFLAKKGIKKIDFVWLDTEGAELMILSGATNYLKEASALSVEVNFQEFRKGMTQFADLNKFLTDQDFELKYIWSPHFDKWQGVALYVKKSRLTKPLTQNEASIFPNFIPKDQLFYQEKN